MALTKVTSGTITDSAVTAAKIADGTVVAAEIADDAIVAAKIADDAVTTAKIANSAITDAKISAVAATKLSGTIADARFPSTLPAASGINLTALNATNLGSGTVPTARLGSGTANNGVFLRGDGTWDTAGSTSASDLTSGTLPMARLSGTLPALNGSALTNMPSTLSVKVMTASYNMANAPAGPSYDSVNYTGCGFQPSAVICFYCVSSDIVGGWTMSDFTTQEGTVLHWNGSFPGKNLFTTPNTFITLGRYTVLSSTSGPANSLVYTTYAVHSDGITINYQKNTASASGTLLLRFFFIK